MDLAGLFGKESRQALILKLAEYERETFHQIGVLTVPDLNGEAIETFSLRVTNAWGLGRRDLDNGILVVVAPNERTTRIEVGYGLEGVISDDLAAEIIQEQMIPAFRHGDFESGIESGVEALMNAARNYEIPPEKRQ